MFLHFSFLFLFWVARNPFFLASKASKFLDFFSKNLFFEPSLGELPLWALFSFCFSSFFLFFFKLIIFLTFFHVFHFLISDIFHSLHFSSYFFFFCFFLSFIYLHFSSCFFSLSSQKSFFEPSLGEVPLWALFAFFFSRQNVSPFFFSFFLFFS